MRLHTTSLTPVEMSAALSTLLSLDREDPPETPFVLYNYKDRAELVSCMPTFDEWRLVPGGLAGQLNNTCIEVTSYSDEDIDGN
ncbi:hypothetical protein D1007_43325 [Hordeum vulgare]|nr:hypothetical protein D1007_43325 [Hordeum vulgare]